MHSLSSHSHVPWGTGNCFVEVMGNLSFLFLSKKRQIHLRQRNVACTVFYIFDLGWTEQTSHCLWLTWETEDTSDNCRSRNYLSHSQRTCRNHHVKELSLWDQVTLKIWPTHDHQRDDWTTPLLFLGIRRGGTLEAEKILQWDHNLLVV